MSDKINSKEIFGGNELVEDDLVYTRGHKGGIQSAGYRINSEIMKAGMPIMETKGKLNDNSHQKSNTNQSGGKVSERFKDLAIPVGLLLMNQKPIKHYVQSNSDEIIDDTLYNKLISIASENEKLKNVNKVRKTKYNNRHKRSNKKSKKRVKK